MAHYGGIKLEIRPAQGLRQWSTIELKQAEYLQLLNTQQARVVRSLMVRWQKRNARELAMALTKDVESGIITSENYAIIQQDFADFVIDWVKEELVRVKEFFASSREELKFEDIGVGQGWMLPLAKMAFELGFDYRVWEFTDQGFENGKPILEDIFTDERGVVTKHIEHILVFGILQLLFGDNPEHHYLKGYAFLLICRTLQDNKKDYEIIVSNIPGQARKGATVVIVTIFEEKNEHIVYTDSRPKSRATFLKTFNAKCLPGEEWEVVREEDFPVYKEKHFPNNPEVVAKSEIYTILACRQINTG